MQVPLLKYALSRKRVNKMEVKLISYTANADELCESIGGICTNKKPSEGMLNRIMNLGHLSIVEHAVYTFKIQGVSRILTHQLVRHRIASYTQQSQRYVESDFKFVTPPKLQGNKAYEEFMEVIWEVYREFNKTVPREDARYILPGAACTEIIVTMNARELLHFFELRLHKTSQWEIRNMAALMLEECKKVSPIIFSNAGLNINKEAKK